MAMCSQWFICILPFLLVYSSECYQNGPPVTTKPALCTKMFPSHNGAQFQTGKSSFSIILGTTCYNPGQRLEVTVTLGKGFLLREDKFTGTFETQSMTEIEALTCDGKDNMAVGHKGVPSSTSASFMWHAPSNHNTTVKFIATVVKTLEEFWRIESCVLRPCSSTAENENLCRDNMQVTSGSSKRPQGYNMAVYMLTAVLCIVFVQLRRN